MITEAWDVTYSLTVKTSAVKHVRSNTKKHNPFLSLLTFCFLNTVTAVPISNFLFLFPQISCPVQVNFLDLISKFSQLLLPMIFTKKCFSSKP